MSRKALYSFFIAFLLLIAVTVINRKSFNRMQDYTFSVDHSHQIIHLFEQLSNHFKSAQIYSPNYEKKGDRDYYRLYKQEAENIVPEILKLKVLVKGHPVQAGRVDSLATMISGQINTLMRKNIVEIMEAGESWRLERLFQIHTMIQKGIDHEQRELVRLKNELETSTEQTGWLTFVFSVIAVVLILATFFSNIFNVRKRKWLEGFLESVLNTSQNGIVSYKAVREHGQIIDFKIEFVNRAIEKLLGFESEDLIGKRLSEVPSYLKSSDIFNRYVKVVERGRQQSFEALYTRGNIQKWMYISLARREDGLTASFHDISALKKYEEELKANIRKLESSNYELEQYAYAASHDLQEPLRKIRMYGSHLQAKQQGKLDEIGRHDIERILTAAERMSALISDLLAFSSLKKENAFSETDLNGVLKNVLDDLEVVIQQKDATIQVDKLPVIEAIPLQMNQLFYNLVNNALKFSKPGIHPVLRISSHLLKPAEVKQYSSLVPDASYYEIVFADNGLGFDEAYSEQIFGLFKRLTDKQLFPGSGIGLALCRKVVTNHQGYIYAKSKEMEGASFHVILPLRQTKTTADPATDGTEGIVAA